MKRIITILICSILISSCNHLDKGEVIGRHYEPTNQQLIVMPLTISTGKSMTVMMIPYFVTDYEDYVLHIKGTHDGEEVVEEVYVTRSCYNSLKDGSIWYKDDNCSFSDDNNTKERRD